MPLQTYSSFQRLTKLCGTKVPNDLITHLNAIKVRLLYALFVKHNIEGSINPLARRSKGQGLWRNIGCEDDSTGHHGG